MSSKLDQSLEAIASANRPKRRNSDRRSSDRRVSGGVNKNRKPTAPNTPAVAVNPYAEARKIVVSGLPDDVSEQQVKDYFKTTYGPVQKVTLSYNAQGKSIGKADILFEKKGVITAANVKTISETKIDGRSLQVEVSLKAEAPKQTLANRISAPKQAPAPKQDRKQQNKPKPAARKAQRPSRPKAKTVEELDAEMTEYFDDSSAAANAAPAPVAPAADVDVDVDVQ